MALGRHKSDYQKNGERKDFMIIKGEWATRRVWIDGKELLPDDSLKVRNHSPDGFNWGYHGSGPAQLALAIMLVYGGGLYIESLYQEFKRVHIATLPQADFEIFVDIGKWIEGKMK